MSDTAANFRVPAAAYDRYVGRYAPDLAGQLVAAAGVEAGMRVVDVGCGPGAVASAAAAIVGEANVAAVDPSEPFAAAARERLPGVDVRVAPAEELPFEDDTFDVALAQLVVNFMRDPEVGVREMARVTREGGKVGACVWDYADGMTLIRTFFDSAIAVDPAAAEHDEGQKMPYCREGELAGLFEHVGLRDVRAGELVAHADYDSFADLIAPLASGVGPAGAYYTSLDDAGRQRLEDEMRRRLGVDEAPFTLSARAWYAVGVV